MSFSDLVKWNQTYTSDESDNVDISTHTDRLQTLRHRPRATDLDDVINAPASSLDESKVSAAQDAKMSERTNFRTS